MSKNNKLELSQEDIDIEVRKIFVEVLKARREKSQKIAKEREERGDNTYYL